jgi:hypothetical protein
MFDGIAAMHAANGRMLADETSRMPVERRLNHGNEEPMVSGGWRQEHGDQWHGL